MQYFKNIKTVEELSERFRELQFIHHPDRNGNSAESTRISKEINAEYIKMKDKLENPVKKSRKRTEKPTTQRNDDEPVERVEKNRFFGEKEVETIAETAAKFGSAILRGLARGFPNQYNRN